MLTEHTLNKVKYTKDSGEVSSRTIIPTFVPKQNIKAVDVTDLSDSERSQVLETVLAYREYTENFQRNMFTFDDWASHTASNTPIKWRTFKLSGLNKE